MTTRVQRRILGALVILALLPPGMAGPARAQNILSFQGSDQPVEITAENGIEWRRKEKGVDPLAFQDRLAELAAGLGNGTVTWEGAVAELGPAATVDSWPLEDLREVAGLLGPPVFEVIKNLPAGSVSGPIQDGAELVVVVLDAVEPMRPLGFEEALPRLRRELETEQRKALGGSVVAELLQQGQFQTLPGSLELLVQHQAEVGAELAAEHGPEAGESP